MADYNKASKNPDNYQIGGGQLHVKKEGETVWLDLGCVRPGSLTITPNVRTLEHKCARGGRLVTDEVAEIERTYTMQVVLDEISTPNLMLLFGASAETAFTQASGTDEEENFTVTAAIKKGYGFRLAKRKVSNVSVTSSSQTYVEGTDYQVNADLGIITIMRATTIPDSTVITVQYDAAAITGTSFKPNTISGIQKLDGVWCVKKTSDGLFDELLHDKGTSVSAVATIAPTGDYQIDNPEDWHSISFTVTLLESSDSTLPFGTVVRR